MKPTKSKYINKKVTPIITCLPKCVLKQHAISALNHAKETFKNININPCLKSIKI